jgi:hypothetical protein
VLAPDVFRDQPTLTGEHVRLEPLTPAVLEDYLLVLDDPEVRRLTGSLPRRGRGQGYGTEVTRLAIDHALAVGLHRVSLTVFAFNPRARRVYEKCGFVLEGRLRDALYWDGEWHDDLVMSVVDGRP